MGKLTLILGGARSGKSHYGEQLAQMLGHEVLFVATAQAFDDEMKARIKRHREQRPRHWRTVEAPTNIAQALMPHRADVVLVDCLTLLVSNVILQLEDSLDEEAAGSLVAAELDALLKMIQSSASHWLIISNEVGLGIVPDNRLARIYRDVLGRANQRLAAAAQRVVFMVAGLPMMVKDEA
jgi:adenosylcobinamide kinase/adenosylcobinamide-phosphate guanylyltransferase